MFENPRRGRQARNIYNKCSENSRSEIVFRTDVFRKLTLGAPVLCLLIYEDDVRPSSFNHLVTLYCTLKSHRTLKPVFSTTCSGVCLYHWSSRSSSAIPHSCNCQCCLVPVRRFPSLSRSIRFSDVSETNGRGTSRQKQNAHACVAFWDSKMYVNVVSNRRVFFNNPCGHLRDRILPTGFEKSSECYS